MVISLKINNHKLINSTFDEMIDRWTEIGYYRSDLVANMRMTDLEMLRSVELFINDIENFKGNIFINKGDILRNTHNGYNFHTQYQVTRYAKKWFPFNFLFNDFLIYTEALSYIFKEVNVRFLKLFYFYNLNILEMIECENDFEIYRREWVDVSERKIDLVRLKVFNEKMKIVDNIDQLADIDMELINIIVNNYRELIKSNRYNNSLDYGFSKKRNDYIKYFLDLLNKFNGLFVFSINFLVKNDHKAFDLPEIKKDFFNTIRSKQGLSSIVGYIGTWEYCERFGYFFRVIFFVPRKKIDDQNELFDALIHTWETFGSSKKEMREGLIYEAELTNISESNQSLRTPYCVIGKKNQTLISAFTDSVINYTTLSEKYFFPAELQIFIFEHMREDKKEKAPDSKFIIDSLKSGFSRSFRGHQKN